MSAFRDRTLTCPRCKHQVTQSVALSIDGEHAAEAHRAILDGSFQRYTCAACGDTFRADGPLIYIDFDRKHWFAVFPRDWEPTWWDVEQEPQDVFERYMIERCPPVVRSWAPGFTVRCVFGLDCLREKLVAIAGGVDDRVLEAYKLDLLRGMGPYELSGVARPRLIEIDAHTAVFHVPRPDELGTGYRFARVRVPRAEIDRITGLAGDEWAPTIAAVSAGPYVDLGRILIPRHRPGASAAPTANT